MERQFFPLSVKEAKKAGISYPSTINRNAGFPTLLRELRKEANISQQKLAEEIDVTKSTIGLYENGDNVPDVKTLYKIARFYNVSTDYLLGLSKEKTTDTNIKAVCNYTGLSESAVIRLTQLRVMGMIEYFNCMMEGSGVFNALQQIKNLDSFMQNIPDNEYVTIVSSGDFESLKNGKECTGTTIPRSIVERQFISAAEERLEECIDDIIDYIKKRSEGGVPNGKA